MSIHPSPEPSHHAASELHLGRDWNTGAIRELIEQKTSAGRKPAFLLVGQHEADLLRGHLGSAFGPESVRSLKNLYYMGLEVIELDTPSFLRTAGMKRILGFRESRGRPPLRKDVNDASFWGFSL
jgi:hypothetical protein